MYKDQLAPLASRFHVLASLRCTRHTQSTGSQETRRRHPGDTPTSSKPSSQSTGSQETPRRHPGDTPTSSQPSSQPPQIQATAWEYRLRPFFWDIQPSPLDLTRNPSYDVRSLTWASQVNSLKYYSGEPLDKASVAPQEQALRASSEDEPAESCSV